jgi:hypothetical protein
MDLNDDNIQRSLNEQKRRFLEEQYGARFPDTPSNLTPEAEGDWLDYITEFERQYTANGQVTLREFLENPDVRPLTSIPPDELAAATDALMDLLIENNVEVHFDREVSDAEVYRFVTEELFNEMMDNIRIDQMMHTFMYDDYHPDEVTHLRCDAETFLNAIFFRHRMIIWHSLSIDRLLDHAGNPILPRDFMQSLEKFYRAVPKFTLHRVETVSVEPGSLYSTVTATVTWSGRASGSDGVVGGSGIAVLKFVASPAGGWDVAQVNVPGWEGGNGEG